MDDLSKSKIFFFCCLVFISGIALASFFPKSADSYFFFFGFFASVILSIIIWEYKRIRLVFLAGSFLFLAFWRFGVSLEDDNWNKIRNHNGGKADFVGVITKEPDIREDKIKYEIEVESLGGKRVGGKVLANAGLYPQFKYGDKVHVSCRLEAPEKIEDFAYDRYLARYDIYSLCYFPKMQLLSSGEGNLFFAKIFALKDSVRGKIDRCLSEPESGLAKGFILGDKKAIDDGLNDKFAQIGISHIVAISGANVSILINLIMVFAVGIGLSRKRSFYFSSFLLFLYIILVGFPASAMRAGLMGFLVLWGIYLGRLSKSVNALVLAASVMLFINPKILRDDIGFQLSFLAMLSIIVLYPILDGLLQRIRIPNRFNLREIVAMTMTAQIFTLPILVNNFQQLSSVFLLSNFFVLWTLPILMVVLPVSIIIGFFLESPVVFLASQAILKFIVFVAESLSRFPHASIPVQKISWLVWVFYYFVLLFFVLKYKKRRLAK